MTINSILILISSVLITWFIHKSLSLIIGFNFYTRQGFKLDLFFPLLGAFYYFMKGESSHGDPSYYFKKVQNKQLNKRVTLTHIGFTPQILLSDPKLIKDFLLNKQGHYAKSNDLFSSIKNFFENGLTFSEGKQWKKQRKIISKAFHYDFLKKMVPISVEITNEQFDCLTELSNVNILHEIKKITGEIMCRMFFGKNFSKIDINGTPYYEILAQNIENMMKQAITLRSVLLGNLITKLPLTQLDNSIIQNEKKLKEVAYKTIEERRRNLSGVYGNKDNSRKDLLQILLEQEETDNKLSVDELIGNFFTFLVAGSYTTGHLITALLYFLSTNPLVMQKVLNEINSCIEKQSEITYENLQKLEYLDACIKETLRIIPPSPNLFLRKAVDDHQLDDVQIQSGTIVNISIASLYSGKGLINEGDFVPERWVNGEVDILDPLHKIPFSIGPRSCIGQQLALIDTKIIVIIFLNKFNYQKLSPKEFKIKLRSLLELKDPFIANLSKKKYQFDDS